MLKNKIYFITIASVFLTTYPALGQLSDLFKKSPTSYSTVGIGGGSSHYFGDLSSYATFYYGLYSNVRWNGTINYQIHLNPKFSTRAAFTYARIFGNDATYGWDLADDRAKLQRLRNLHFRNDLMEFTAMGLYNFIPLNEKKTKRSPLEWSPYFGIGIGITSNDPKARGSIQSPSTGGILFDPDGRAYVRHWQSLRSKLNEGQTKVYSSIVPVIPISLGVKTKINQNWILSVEGSFRFSFSDYLDDVSSGSYSNDPNNQFSYRAAEDYYALTGKSRTLDFNKAIGNSDPSPTPPSSYGGDDMIYRTGGRGTAGFMKDSYILTQVTLNYIITNRVKCPPISQ